MPERTCCRPAAHRPGAARRSPAPAPELGRSGIRLQRSLPTVLPSSAQVLPKEQQVLLPGESAAGMLVPVPFIAQASGGAIDRSEAATEAARLARIDPYTLAQRAWQGSPLLADAADALVLQPFALRQACVDDRYPIALVHQLSRDEWIARYTVHLHSNCDSASFHGVAPALLQTLQTEMREGSATLHGLVERAARGAELIDEDEEQVLVRIDADPSQPASTASLFFGVQSLRKHQLHTLRPVKGAS